METQGGAKFNTLTFVIFLVVSIIIGAAGGYIISSFSGTEKASTATKEQTTEAGKKTVGVCDKKKFPDSTEGKLKEGGIEGEGHFHLERPGGESQNVYLTSSIVDLSKYIGKKIKVLGETQKAQKAGWLMDVGCIQVL